MSRGGYPSSVGEVSTMAMVCSPMIKLLSRPSKTGLSWKVGDRRWANDNHLSSTVRSYRQVRLQLPDMAKRTFVSPSHTLFTIRDIQNQ